MYLLTLHDGRRGLYTGRTCENCFFVKLNGEPYWWWIPCGMVATAQELSVPDARDAA